MTSRKKRECESGELSMYNNGHKRHIRKLTHRKQRKTPQLEVNFITMSRHKCEEGERDTEDSNTRRDSKHRAHLSCPPVVFRVETSFSGSLSCLYSLRRGTRTVTV